MKLIRRMKGRMVSRERKREALLHEKLQLLRSITNSHAVDEPTIVLEASNYIKVLKYKVERLHEDIAATSASETSTKSWPKVSVETLEKGYLVNVVQPAGKHTEGLLVYILEAFEELGLNVLEARVSSVHTFHLQAIGSSGDTNINIEEEDGGSNVNAKLVKRRITNAIKNWRKSNE